MTEPTIDALRQAFLDPDSRVRLVADLSATRHAFIEAIAWEGGFLDGVQTHLSENLNAVVGGRGTGKSTVVETIRYAFEIPPRGEKARKAHDVLVRENLGSGGRISIRLRSPAQMDRRFSVVRQLGSPPEVRDESGSRSTLKPIDLVPGAPRSLVRTRFSSWQRNRALGASWWSDSFLKLSATTQRARRRRKVWKSNVRSCSRQRVTWTV